jgi:hypothetical protein
LGVSGLITASGGLTTNHLYVTNGATFAGGINVSSGGLRVTGGQTVFGTSQFANGLSVTGGVGITGGQTVFGTSQFANGLSVTGNVDISNKAYSSATVTGDTSNTLVTKGYADDFNKDWKYVAYTSGSGNWVCPSHVNRVYVVMVAGGGGGQWSQGGSPTTFRNGAAGGIIAFEAIVTPGTSYAYSVGAGGPRPAFSNDHAGSRGGDTTFLGVSAIANTMNNFTQADSQGDGWGSMALHTDTAVTGVTKTFTRWRKRSTGAAGTPSSTAGHTYITRLSLWDKLTEPFGDGLLLWDAATLNATNGRQLSTSGTNWTITTTSYMPGVGGDASSASNSNGAYGGVGGCILIKYFG